MTYLLIPLLCLLASAKVTLQSKFSKTKNEDISDNIFFNGIMFLTVALLFIPSLIKNSASYQTFIYGIIMGILSVVFQFFYICALKKGKMTLTVIINNFSMLIPVSVSVILFDEAFGLTKALGTILALMSFCLNIAKEKKVSDSEASNKNNLLWLTYTILVFISNGLISVNQKIYSMLTPKLQIFEFVAVAYITAAIISFSAWTIISLKTKKSSAKKEPTVIIFGCAAGILLGIFQCLNTFAASVIDGAILYSTYNCGVSLTLTVIGKIIFKEKLSEKQYIGVFIGIAAIVFMCL